MLLHNKTNKLVLLLILSALQNFSYAGQTTPVKAPSKPIAPVQSSALSTSTGSVASQHAHAVDLARNDKIEEGLAILKQLLKAHPDSYPIRRDYVIISTWKGDCDSALENYARIQQHPDQEPYLIVPVSDCLHQQGKDEQALTLLKKSSKANPDDTDVKQAYQDLQQSIALSHAPDITISVGNNNSDAGNREWFWDVRYSRLLDPGKPQLRGYLHYFSSHALDAQFDTGDMNRFGIGVLYRFNPQWLLDQELFTDLQNDDSGSRTQLRYFMNSQTALSGEYSTNTSDIPLRAKAQEIDARRIKIDADYHSTDYRWELYAAAAKYRFTDSNRRTTLYGSAGYAYLMKQRLEERVILELSKSKNTLANTLYYNPASDRGVNLVHRTSYVYDSKYDRHVDHFSLFVGKYDEQGYDTENTYGAQFQQEYEFDSYTALSWSAGYASHIYDGQREGEWSFLITLSRKLD